MSLKRQTHCSLIEGGTVFCFVREVIGGSVRTYWTRENRHFLFSSFQSIWNGVITADKAGWFLLLWSIPREQSLYGIHMDKNQSMVFVIISKIDSSHSLRMLRYPRNYSYINVFLNWLLISSNFTINVLLLLALQPFGSPPLYFLSLSI